jgi:hypothetical protein
LGGLTFKSLGKVKNTQLLFLGEIVDGNEASVFH